MERIGDNTVVPKIELHDLCLVLDWSTVQRHLRNAKVLPELAEHEAGSFQRWQDRWHTASFLPNPLDFKQGMMCHLAAETIADGSGMLCNASLLNEWL